ncbi:MAG TPA: hypothetical protein VMS65_18120, partial [Polyangiaceae bacterium]|nr:hypothetical protein [Polyangiaceae bacterium]
MKSIALCELNRPLFRGRRPWAVASVTLAFLVGCGAAGPGELERTDEDALAATSGPEDGLADAFETFVESFSNNGFSARFLVGFAFHP